MSESIVSKLSTIVEHVTASRHLSFAGYVVLLYDHLLTFGDEVELIWPRLRNPVSIIFIMNRYLTPLILAVDVYDKGGLSKHLDERFCQIWFILEGYLNFMLLAAVHALTAMRVNVLWGNKPKMRCALIIAYILYFSITFAILTPAMFQSVATIKPEEILLHSCWGKIVGYIWLIWIPALVLELMIFTLTAIRAWQDSAANLQLPITRTLYRDGFQYFVVIMLCTSFPLVVWSLAPPTLAALPKYVTMGLVNVMAFRLVLNLRAHSRKPDALAAFDEYELPESKLGPNGAVWGLRGSADGSSVVTLS
ncbi:hypothetical protein BDV93DRAFT_528223 [Ceratobasidium sp. AG-I]|nr:hypothetical protein BDV93DRAFT_528223 [Ceratobasidium sp. AG-I]